MVPEDIKASGELHTKKLKFVESFLTCCFTGFQIHCYYVSVKIPIFKFSASKN
jgi:hypothetical protein